MTKSLVIFVSSLSSLVAVQPAAAVIFNETTDFPNSSGFGTGSVSIGTLDLGANTVTGSLNGTCVTAGNCNAATGSGDSQDSFLFQVAAGRTLTGVSVTTTYSGVAGFLGSVDIRNPTTDLLFEPFIPGNGNFSTVTAIGAGTYSLSYFGQRADVAGTYSVNYTIGLITTANATAVPEPATWGMLVLGFGAAGAALRRRRAAAIVA